MSSGLPVPDDILHNILCYSQTFSSLFSEISTCKSFYNVFQTHPKSIMRAVAHNICGPPLPQALRCIRHPDIAPKSLKKLTRWGSNSNSDAEDVDMTVERRSKADDTEYVVDLDSLSEAPITGEETFQLVENAAVARRLEDLFSRRQVHTSYLIPLILTLVRYVNRGFQTTQLDPTESQVFCAAVYHLMLYSSIFHPSTWISDLPDDEDPTNDTLGESRRREALIKRSKFLTHLSTPELLQVHSVAEFVKELVAWCVRMDGYPDDIQDFALAAGPTLVLECFDNPQHGLRPIDDVLDFFEEELDLNPNISGYLSAPLNKVLAERKEKPPPSDFTHWRSISSRIREENAQCDRCHQSYGLQVYHESTLGNYSDPNISVGSYNSRYEYRWDRISNYLRANLRYNRVETAALALEAEEHGQNLLSKIWSDLWDLNMVKQQETAPSFPDWTRDGFLCEACFRAFMVENLWAWFRYRKSAKGPVLENCWYGYNCRTQTHREEHAAKLNVCWSFYPQQQYDPAYLILQHLCEQTRN
ncbi:hypothetical protein D9757_007050 [Collybiopsis confluens]|uniref:Uncharacterized protein n=1 Tax=Collybiopsis confluens TaxID=2823264 RepID=A0A8H5HCB6_9AGAR|nr:hypothetical protein D9757_007050 [Collybiopsis confluens]